VEELMRQATRVSKEQDDLLRTISLVRSNTELTVPLFDRLVEVCLEALFLDLRHLREEGALGDDDYIVEVFRLATQCREVGLVPLAFLEDLDDI
jgi:hypothetical protein